MIRAIAVFPILLAGLLVEGAALAQEERTHRPKVGDSFVSFELPSVRGQGYSFDTAKQKKNSVIVVLRGFPGYTCPLCTKQANDFLSVSEQFEEKNANVLFIYPGSDSQLARRAKDFLRSAKLPKNYELLIDNNYSLTQKLGLRWDAENETAYPSSFVVDSSGKVAYVKISDSHGGRSDVQEVLAALRKLQ